MSWLVRFADIPKLLCNGYRRSTYARLENSVSVMPSRDTLPTKSSCSTATPVCSRIRSKKGIELYNIGILWRADTFSTYRGSFCMNRHMGPLQLSQKTPLPEKRVPQTLWARRALTLSVCDCSWWTCMSQLWTFAQHPKQEHRYLELSSHPFLGTEEPLVSTRCVQMGWRPNLSARMLRKPEKQILSCQKRLSSSNFWCSTFTEDYFQ